jgi:hypothetical protein
MTYSVPAVDDLSEDIEKQLSVHVVLIDVFSPITARSNVIKRT